MGSNMVTLLLTVLTSALMLITALYIYRLDQKRQSWSFPIAAAALIAAISSGSIILAVRYKWPEFEFQQKVEQIDRLQVTAQQLSSETRDVRDEVAGIRSKVEVIDDKIDRVTTKQILDQLNMVDARVNDLSNQLASLQQIISPSNANEILTVARLKAEIVAREDLRIRLKTKLTVS
jgi:hypothetical protein